MTMTLKYVVFFTIVLADAVAGQIVIRHLNNEGQGSIAPVIVSSLVVSTVAVGIVLFKIL